jgi:hypothetical protein
MAPGADRTSSGSLTKPVVGIPRYLAGRIGYATYATSVWDTRFRAADVVEGPFSGSVIPVGDLREQLAERDAPREPELVKVRGTLFPCILLFPAYWERSAERDRGWIAWRDELQEWLFYGFEQWGPSWEINHPTAPDTLLGQLGSGDELESILLVLEGDIARTARAALDDAMAVDVEVTGILTHREQLGDSLASERERWGTQFDSGILATDREAGHDIEVVGKPETYSAYLWQCWAPTDRIANPDDPRVDESFFVWEHTDVTKPDAVAYNLDSLERKADYLRERYGELMLVQKSSRLVPGEARFPTAQFNALLRQRSTA